MLRADHHCNTGKEILTVRDPIIEQLATLCGRNFCAQL
jgi:hypothetical protein